MGPHPTEDTLLELAGGKLQGEPLAAATAHLDDCAECRKLIGALGSAVEGKPRGEPSNSVSMPFERGMQLGRYTLLERLGSGGMGTVYAAYDPELRRRVAIKLLKEDLTDTEEAQARLLREARSLARVSHPNVVAIHDVGVHQGRVFLAMELVGGSTLADWLHEQRPWRDVVAAFKSAARGLAAAHGAGVIHRDFKPANVLVTQDGRVCVTDFGLAHHERSEDSLTEETETLTRPGAMIGTPAYMAPEQFKGHDADAKTDQFNFCVGFFVALYGQKPFAGESIKELAASVCSGRLRHAEKSRGVPGWLQQIVAKGLSHASEDRFESMEALIGAIERGERRYVTFGLAWLRVIGGLVWLGTVVAARALGEPGADSQLPGLAVYVVAGVVLLEVQRRSRRLRHLTPLAVGLFDVPLVWWQRRLLVSPYVIALAPDKAWGTVELTVSLFMVLLAMTVMALDVRAVILAAAIAIPLQFELCLHARPDYLFGALFSVLPMLVLGWIGAIAAYRIKALTDATDLWRRSKKKR